MYIVKNDAKDIQELLGCDDGTVEHQGHYCFMAAKGDAVMDIYAEPIEGTDNKHLRIYEILLDGEEYTPHLTRKQKKQQICYTIHRYANILSQQLILDKDASNMCMNYDKEVSFVRPYITKGIHIFQGLSYIAELFNLEITYLEDEMQVLFPLNDNEQILLYQLR